MPVLDVEQDVETPDQTRRSAEPKDPLAGAQLLCPYCGWTYEPEQGCFCVRIESRDITATH